MSGVLTLAIVAAFLLANLLSVAPQLHEKIHGSAVNHECAVTLVASGKYELHGSPPLVAVPQSFVQFASAVMRLCIAIPALFLSASIFEHAPPPIS